MTGCCLDTNADGTVKKDTEGNRLGEPLPMFECMRDGLSVALNGNGHLMRSSSTQNTLERKHPGLCQQESRGPCALVMKSRCLRAQERGPRRSCGCGRCSQLLSWLLTLRTAWPVAMAFEKQPVWERRNFLVQLARPSLL